MEADRVGDVLVGAAMVGIGIAPGALFLLGATPSGGYGVLGSLLSKLAVQAVVTLFGLFFAGMGVATARYGRPERGTPDLY